MIKTIKILRRDQIELKDGETKLSIKAICLTHLAIAIELTSRQMKEIYYRIYHIRTGLALPWLSKDRNLTIELARLLDSHSEVNWDFKDTRQFIRESSNHVRQILYDFADRDEDEDEDFESYCDYLTRYLWKNRKKKLKLLGVKIFDRTYRENGILDNVHIPWVKALKEFVQGERFHRKMVNSYKRSIRDD